MSTCMYLNEYRCIHPEVLHGTPVKTVRKSHNVHGEAIHRMHVMLGTVCLGRTEKVLIFFHFCSVHLLSFKVLGVTYQF